MSLSLTADFGELNKLLDHLVKADAEIKPVVFSIVLDVATELDNRVDGDMPVDTGRARAGWGKYKPELLAEGATQIVSSKSSSVTRPSKHTGRMQQSSEADAIWEEIPDELAVIEGTHVPYTLSLDEGHSAQAPAGFIEMNVEWAQQQLESQARIGLEEEFKKI